MEVTNLIDLDYIYYFSLFVAWAMGFGKASN